jgi:hypothetical protein
MQYLKLGRHTAKLIEVVVVVDVSVLVLSLTDILTVVAVEVTAMRC